MTGDQTARMPTSCIESRGRNGWSFAICGDCAQAAVHSTTATAAAYHPQPRILLVSRDEGKRPDWPKT